MEMLANSLRLDGRDWDRWGMVASVLCVVHCISTPIAADRAITPGCTG